MDGTVISMKSTENPQALTVRRFNKPSVDIGTKYKRKRSPQTQLKIHLLQLAGILAVFVAPILLIYFLFKFPKYDLRKYRKDVELNIYMEAIRWLLSGLIVCAATFLISLILTVLPFFFEKFYRFSGRVVPDSTKVLLNQLDATRGYFLLMVFGIAGAITAQILFPYKITEEKIISSAAASGKDPDAKSLVHYTWQFYVARSMTCIALLGFLLFIEKAIIQKIAFAFHRTHFGERVDENNFALSAIHRLCSSLNLENLFKIIEDEHEKIEEKNEETHSFIISGEKRTDRLAESLFGGLARGKGMEAELVYEDFQKHLNASDAQKIFEMIDANGNGGISLQELKAFLSNIFEDKEALFRSMEDNEKILSKLNILFLCLSVLFFILLSVTILALPAKTYVGSLSTLFFSATFIFGKVLSGTFTSLVFIFFAHPYDVNDKIQIEKENYLVEEIQFLMTIMISLNNNQKMYFPNAKLYSKNIINIRRSPNMSETVNIYVEATTPNQTLLILDARLKAFAKQNSRDFGDVTISGFNLLHKKTLELSISFGHKSNFQDDGLQARRHKMFMEYLFQVIKDLDIRFSTEAKY